MRHCLVRGEMSKALQQIGVRMTSEAGWFQDPEEWDNQRYWDGVRWTDEVRPKQRDVDPPAAHQPAEMVSQPEAIASRFGRKSPQDRAEKEAAKQRAAVQKQTARQHAAADREARAFAASPVGKARAAFERGDQVFQYSIDVMNQQAIVVIMMGSATAKSTSDPSEVLNAVSREGWELVNGSFVFVEEGQQSRDKFMASGQNVAVKGTTFGYYLFKRNPELRKGDRVH